METVRIGYFSGSKLSVRTYILPIFRVWNLISCVSAYSQTDLPQSQMATAIWPNKIQQRKRDYFSLYLSFFKRKEIFPRSSSNSPPFESRWPGVHAHSHTSHRQGTKPPFWVYTSQNLLSEVRGRRPNKLEFYQKRGREEEIAVGKAINSVC